MTREEFLKTLKGHTCEHCREGMSQLKQALADAMAQGCDGMNLPTSAVRWLVDYVEAHMPPEDNSAAN
jgi:hypothetical protein